MLTGSPTDMYTIPLPFALSVRVTSIRWVIFTPYSYLVSNFSLNIVSRKETEGNGKKVDPYITSGFCFPIVRTEAADGAFSF